MISSLAVLAQSWPVAIDDYANCFLGQVVTINVVNNDYHTSGLDFHIRSCDDAQSFTDSTISFYVDYEKYYNATNLDTIKISYLLIDKDDIVHQQSIGTVNITITGNNYYNYLDINNIKAKIQANGMQFWPGPAGEKCNMISNENPIYEFPAGSGKNTIYNSSIWIGGLDNNNVLKLAAERYRQGGFDYWPGPISIETDTLMVEVETAIKWQQVWKLSAQEIRYHINHYNDADYIPLEAIATWPAHGDVSLNQARWLAPFIDVNHDSIYNPMEGDYPLIRGDQCIFFILNDQREHSETSGEAMGIEIHVMAYEFSAADDDPLAGTMFMSYKIYNRSSINYTDTYLGINTDFEIGYSKDDYVGCDVGRGAFFGYNGDDYDGNIDSTIYGSNIPAQGIVILGGPAMDNNNQDDPDDQCDESINGVGFNDGIKDNERYGMSRFVYYENNNEPIGDPVEDFEYYNYLKGLWMDGSAMEYGGNGHTTLGAYGPSARFMFPGTSDPCFWGTNGIEPFGPVEWTEETAGNTPYDRRGLSVMGPFTFEAGSVEKLDIAFVSAFANDDNSAIDMVLNDIDLIRNNYLQDPSYFGYQWLDNEEITEDNPAGIKAFPVPACDQICFYCDLSDNQADYLILDITGNILQSGIIYKNNTVVTSVESLKPGIYFIVISGSNDTYSTKFIKN